MSIAPCVAARRDNPSLRCDPRGNYHPVQCREVTPVSEGTATPTAADTMPMPRRGPGYEECRCVYPNGTTIAGSTRLVMGKMDRPHCHNLISKTVTNKCISSKFCLHGLFWYYYYYYYYYYCCCCCCCCYHQNMKTVQCLGCLDEVTRDIECLMEKLTLTPPTAAHVNVKMGMRRLYAGSNRCVQEASWCVETYCNDDTCARKYPSN